MLCEAAVFTVYILFFYYTKSAEHRKHNIFSVSKEKEFKRIAKEACKKASGKAKVSCHFIGKCFCHCGLYFLSLILIVKIYHLKP